MDKTNNHNNKGKKRIQVANTKDNKPYKKNPPKYENFKGEPIE